MKGLLFFLLPFGVFVFFFARQPIANEASVSEAPPATAVSDTSSDNTSSALTEGQTDTDSVTLDQIDRSAGLGDVSPPTEGSDCKDMQNYFNQNFGRSDTRFSNYEGRVVDFVGLRCSGGVAIQSLPTGTKTCSADIIYWSYNGAMQWESKSSNDCFVSR